MAQARRNDIMSNGLAALSWTSGRAVLLYTYRASSCPSRPMDGPGAVAGPQKPGSDWAQAANEALATRAWFQSSSPTTPIRIDQTSTAGCRADAQQQLRPPCFDPSPSSCPFSVQTVTTRRPLFPRGVQGRHRIATETGVPSAHDPAGAGAGAGRSFSISPSPLLRTPPPLPLLQHHRNISSSFAQSVFFGESDTALGLQTCLYDASRGLDHPDKGRFGSHFLLFPLLGVNKHLRKEVCVCGAHSICPQALFSQRVER